MKTLEWHPEILGPMKHADAPKLEGWRMPTRAELIALFDSGDFPESMRNKYFWSSTPFVRFPTHSWSVHFDVGRTDAYGTLNADYVRLVREMEN